MSTQTTYSKQDTWGDKTFKPDKEAMEKLLKQAGNKKILFVLLIGSYQTGKSSKIAKMIDSKEVVIGNGSKETTQGAFVYGPVHFNELCKRFGIRSIQDDDDKCIFFIDTEGVNGFKTGDTSRETTYLLSEFIAPYAALSNVIITVAEKNIKRFEVECMEEMFKIFKTIRNSGNQKKVNIINVINDSLSLDEKAGNYEQQRRNLLPMYQEKSSILFDDIVLLPNFNTDKKWWDQDTNYNKGFAFFVKKLINLLDNCKNEAFHDGKEASDVFNKLTKITEFQNIGELAKQVRESAKSSAYERIYQPIVDKYFMSVLNKISEIDESKTSDEQENIKKSITNEFKQNLKKKIPKMVMDDTDFTKYINKKVKDIKKRLSERFDSLKKKSESMKKKSNDKTSETNDSWLSYFTKGILEGLSTAFRDQNGFSQNSENTTNFNRPPSPPEHMSRNMYGSPHPGYHVPPPPPPGCYVRPPPPPGCYVRPPPPPGYPVRPPPFSPPPRH